MRQVYFINIGMRDTIRRRQGNFYIYFLSHVRGDESVIATMYIGT